ncbi:cyanophycin synthetase [Nitrosomonas sp. Is35]|uniref:cyanophycin synthetase n=1 Tax=unclassified Nitrosomonas TaxID=2609265 RepID=UPI00294B8755|nr:MULTISPECIES: cyanophycin synthetase [unclassified Nitrosomonas]MDV6342849.1 cyanophycin synthetase [Nitrosomonas sp. Is24]MDV6348756.1 cyanophycin synthetase [Nitrosomonas sp. Is35]
MSDSLNLDCNSTKDIKFLEIKHLNGPNMWTYYPALEATVDIGELEDFPSDKIPGFYERLSGWLPSLIEHRCSYEERGGFLRRVKDGTWPCHILEHVTLELQNLAGMRGGFGRARETSVRGVYKVALSAWQAEITTAALHSARELVLAAMNFQQSANPFYDVEGAIQHLRDMVDSLWLGPSTACIVDAAMARNIPATRLIAKGNLVQLGYGARCRHIWTAETDRTSAIAEGISRDKDLTKSLLQSCGVPVPEGRIVESAEAAWEAANDIGMPVVIKPCDGNHGRGVFIELSQREEIESAYRMALREGTEVLVERYIAGTEHRLLIVGGRLIAATRGDSVSVMGDGVSTIAELIESQINSDPRRGSTEDHPLNLIRLDSAAQMEIAHQGYHRDSVVPTGIKVLIQRNGNHAFDVTDQVHPATASIASLAARVIGLDIAGIDLVTSDISRPLHEQGGAIVEVNAGPSLLMHIRPAVGKPRPVGKAIVDHLFPGQENGRIPIVGISGSYGKTSVAYLVARLLVLSGKQTGLACSDGLYLDYRQIDKSNSANWAAANRTLLNPTVEAAVFENGFDVLLNEGLAYDSCQVGVITNIDPEHHFGHHGIETHKQVYTVLRSQVDMVTPTAAAIDDVEKDVKLPVGAAVLNANDEMLVEMSELCHGEVIYFSSEPELPVIKQHCASGTGPTQGKRAVIVRNGRVVLVSGSNELILINLREIVSESGTKSTQAIENILAAVGAAWALGIEPNLIRVGIETFGFSQEKYKPENQNLLELQTQGIKL